MLTMDDSIIARTSMHPRMIFAKSLAMVGSR